MMNYSFTTVSVAGLQYKIRELKLGDLGLQLWPGSQILLEWLSGLRDWQGVGVLELGAGTGALAVGLARLGAVVYATDYDSEALKNIQFNVDRNALKGQVHVLNWDWRCKPPAEVPFPSVQYCVCAEGVYLGTSALLSDAVAAVKDLAPHAEVFATFHERGGGAVKSFVQSCAERGLHVCAKKPPAHRGDAEGMRWQSFAELEDIEENAFESGTLASPSAPAIARITAAECRTAASKDPLVQLPADEEVAVLDRAFTTSTLASAEGTSQHGEILSSEA